MTIVIAKATVAHMVTLSATHTHGVNVLGMLSKLHLGLAITGVMAVNGVLLHQQAGFRVDHTPSAGAIIVFVPGQSVGGQWTADPTYGHVGYVQSVSGSSVTITQGGMGFANATGPNTATLSDGGSYMYIHR
ncbi:CHAP domain-containing protein [Latilactobacillus sakei]